VGFHVLLGGVLPMLGGVGLVGVRQVCVMSSFFMVAVLVMFGGLVVVARGMLMMFSCLFVMMRCFL
jgi:hypothetical protein